LDCILIPEGAINARIEKLAFDVKQYFITNCLIIDSKLLPGKRLLNNSNPERIDSFL